MSHASLKRTKIKNRMPVPSAPVKELDVGLKIVALTPAGVSALAVHERDRLKEPWAQRKVFDGLYLERVTTDERGLIRVIEILHKNAKVATLIPFDSMVVPIKAAMLENGAVLNVDYELIRVGA